MRLAEENKAREELMDSMSSTTVTTSSTTTTPSASVSGGGLGLVDPNPTPVSSALGGGGGAGNPFSLVNPELLARIQQLIIQGGAPAPTPSPPVAGLGQVALPVAGQSQVPLLPPGLLAPAAPLPTLPPQAPTGPNILLGAAMAVTSPLGDLDRLVQNQHLMFSHQHQLARNQQLEAAKHKVVG